MSEEFKLGKLFKSVKMTVIIHLSSYWRNSDLSARILQHHTNPPLIQRQRILTRVQVPSSSGSVSKEPKIIFSEDQELGLVRMWNVTKNL